MKVNITDQIAMSLKTPNIDSRFGPYNSISEAYEALGPNGYGKIVSGMHFGIKEPDGAVTVYEWTKDEGTEDDCERVKFRIISFAGIINDNVTIAKSSSIDNASDENVYYLKQFNQFVYKELDYYINWNNRYRWSDSDMLPYKYVLYYNNSNNIFYYYNGEVLQKISSVDIEPSNTVPLMDGVGSVGTESRCARGDHRHPSDTSKQDVITDLNEIRLGSKAGATAYQKPSNGIPSSDLSDNVKNSLNKANSAVQSSDVPIEITSSGIGDLDISDEQGYVLGRFENGHFRTKNFYSGDVYTKSEIDAMFNNLQNQ